jgi:hypothetical protein
MHRVQMRSGRVLEKPIICIRLSISSKTQRAFSRNPWVEQSPRRIV